MRAVLGHFLLFYVHPYMDALEQASSFANVAPLAAFIAELAKAQAKGSLPRPR